MLIEDGERGLYIGLVGSQGEQSGQSLPDVRRWPNAASPHLFSVARSVCIIGLVYLSTPEATYLRSNR